MGRVQLVATLNGCGLVDGQVWKHLHTVVILDLVFHPTLWSAFVHLEGSDLQPSGAAREGKGHFRVFRHYVWLVHAWEERGGERRGGRGGGGGGGEEREGRGKKREGMEGENGVNKKLTT